MSNKIFATTAISTLLLLLSCSGDEIIVNSDNNPNQISDIKFWKYGWLYVRWVSIERCHF